MKVCASCECTYELPCDSACPARTHAERQAELDAAPSAESLKEIGNAMFMAKDLMGALDAYSRAIALDAEGYVYYSNRSMCNFALGDFDAALIDAVSCTTLGPHFAKGHFRKAAAEIELGLFPEGDPPWDL
jgi:hypothetical protein